MCKILFGIIVAAMFLCSFAFAGAEDIQIIRGPYRTIECYRYNNYWFGEITAPVSKNATRWWGYEDTAWTYPTGSTPGTSNYGPEASCRSAGAGRGFVYGTVADLATYTDLADYQSKIVELPNDANLVANGNSSLYWDLADDSVLYGNFKDGTIKKIDFDDAEPAWATVCDWVAEPPTGLGKLVAGAPYTTIYGWGQSTGELVGIYGGHMWQDPTPGGTPANDGVRCNVSTGVETDVDYASEYFCADGYNDATYVAHIDGQPMHANGHGAFAKANTDLMAKYGVGEMQNGVRVAKTPGSCTDTLYVLDDKDWDGVSGAHANWKYSDNWFVTDLFKRSTAPSIAATSGAAQNYFTQGTLTYGEKRRFLTQSTTGGYANSDLAVAWTAETVYAVGTVVVKSGYVQRAYVGGTSGSSEPTWPTSEWGTVVDGTVAWQAQALDLINWNPNILLSLNSSGTAIAYTATDGKYSWDDYYWKGYHTDYVDYEPGSMWIAKISIGAPVAPTGFQRKE